MPNINNINLISLNNNKSNNKKDDVFLPLYNSFFFKVNLDNYSFLLKVPIYIARLIVFILFLLYLLIRQIVVIVVGLCNQSIVFRRIFVAVVVLLTLFFVDFLIHFGKIYPGVFVSDIDLSWKTKEEAAQIIDSELNQRLNSKNITIYGNQQSKDIGDSYDNAALNEQLNVDLARDSVIFWKLNDADLDASLPVNEIVDQALNSTRGLNNIPLRIEALFFKYQVKPFAQYNQDAIDVQIAQINHALGRPVNNPTCSINNGIASAVNGNNGFLVDQNKFYDNLNTAFFEIDESKANFVAELHDVDMQISFKTAQKMSENINNWLTRQINFNYKDDNLILDRISLGDCINVNVGNRYIENASSCSVPNINNDNICIFADCDKNILSSVLMERLNIHMDNSSYSLNFINQEDGVYVKTQGDFEIPNVNECSNQFFDKFLNNIYVYENDKYNKYTEENENSVIDINVESSEIDDYVSFDYALQIGLVQQISKYTTSYTSGAGTESRNKNISLSTVCLNNTICHANGGLWSFNQIVGDTTPDKGYEQAGTIIDDRYSKSIGGGVCQVATTVYNAVYESGLDIVTRHNHDLYISSYPVGRDASIAYPYMDFEWQNNEKSDVLVMAESTGYSVSVYLYGVNPQYQVKTELGQWAEGEKFTQKFVVDPSKEPNSKFTQTEGSDGKSITIKRLVYNKEGALIKNEDYTSKYNPKNEIIVLGPGDEANHLLEEKKARLKDETDNW